MKKEHPAYDRLLLEIVDNEYVAYGSNSEEMDAKSKLGRLPCGSAMTEISNIDVEMFKDGLFDSLASYYINDLGSPPSADVPYNVLDIFEKYMFSSLRKHLSEPVTILLYRECLDILINMYNPDVVAPGGGPSINELVTPSLREGSPSSANVIQIYVYLDGCIEKIEAYKLLADSFIATNDKSHILSNLKQNIRTRFAGDERGNVHMIYEIHDLDSFVAIDISTIIRNNLRINKCANCGKFFIPQVRSDEIYCDNIFVNQRTCKQIGYEMKLRKDEFKSAFRSAYKTQHARIKYNSHNKEYRRLHFEPWEAATKRAQAEYTEKNDIEGFRQWLKDNKDAF